MEPEDQGHKKAITNQRFTVAMLCYAALAFLAWITLDGTLRLVVWLCLGLFAFKTVLVVLRRRMD